MSKSKTKNFARYQASIKAKGICYRCRQPLTTTTTICADCSLKSNRRQSELKAERKRLNLCAVCAQPREAGATTDACLECRDKLNAKRRMLHLRRELPKRIRRQRDELARLEALARKIGSDDAVTKAMAKLYGDGLSLAAIGKQFGMTRQGVRDRFLRAGIASSSLRASKMPIDPVLLRELYERQRLSLREISRRFGTRENAIRKELAKYNIPKRPPLKFGGQTIDFLRSLKIGDSRLYEPPVPGAYPRLHGAARIEGMKISIKSRGNGQFEITRLA